MRSAESDFSWRWAFLRRRSVGILWQFSSVRPWCFPGGFSVRRAEILRPSVDFYGVGFMGFSFLRFLGLLKTAGATCLHFLSDKEIQRLREQIEDSVGLKTFVSEDDIYIFELALEEIIEIFGVLLRLW